MDLTLTKVILLVEDDENDIEFMQMAMKKAGIGHLLRIASDGRQATDYLDGLGAFADRRKNPLPCLVLLDLKLPIMMGMDVLKWVRQQPRLTTMVVIILSSSSQEADMVKCYRLGANAYLVKPSEPKMLYDLVEMLKGFWFTLNQPTAEAADPSLTKEPVGFVGLPESSMPLAVSSAHVRPV